MNIGERIKYIREQRGLKAKYVAENIGLSPNLLSAIECGRSNATVQQILSLANFFGVTTDYLIKGSENDRLAA